MSLAVGFRVRSHRGTQFRKWANARLSEYLVKGLWACKRRGREAWSARPTPRSRRTT
ncbi:RhuM family protein [Myxococcus sp. AM009]|uniref:RhuM family protein n=1 Tax=Myxococcus sp. AM009 TaxID=2745137 RepID=UPI0034D2829A